MKRILMVLAAKAKNYKQLLKPDKIFLGNTNLMHVLCSHVDKGNERETFFYSQLIVRNQARYLRLSKSKPYTKHSTGMASVWNNSD